jgi:hypothetical protein
VLLCHSKGINARHLGIVRRCINQKERNETNAAQIAYLSALLLTEIVARTIKNLVRKRLREQLTDVKSARKGPTRVIVDFLKPVIGNNCDENLNEKCKLLQDDV